MGQRRKDGDAEKALITAGKEILSIARLLQHKRSYCAADVVQWLLADVRCGELTTAFRKTA